MRTFAAGTASSVTLLCSGLLALLIIAMWRQSSRSYIAVVWMALVASRFAFNLGRLTIRADQFALLLLFVPVFGIRQHRNQAFPEHARFGRYLISYLAIGVGSKILNGASIEAVLRSGAIVGVALLGFWAPPFLARRGISVEMLTRYIISSASVIGSFAAVLGFVSYLIPNVPGVQSDGSNSALHLSFVTFFEANLLGSYLAAALVLALLDSSITAWAKRNRTLAQVGISLGLLATFTRGAWIAFIVGSLVAALALRSHGGSSRRKMITRLSLVFLTIAVAVSSVRSLRENALHRFSNLLNFDSGSGYGRGKIAELAINDWQTSKIFGRGLLSLNTSAETSSAYSQSWIPNFSIAVLHDTGILGATMLLLFVAGTARRLWVHPHPALVAPWLGCLTCLLVASLATQSQILVFFWFLIGVAAICGTPANPNTRSHESNSLKTA